MSVISKAVFIYVQVTRKPWHVCIAIH